MAWKKAVTAKNLEALGAPRLAGLLVALAEADAAVKRRLRVELAEIEGPAAVAQEVRKRLVAIGRAQGFVDWRPIAALAADLDAQRETVAAKIAARDPALALELMWRFMALARSVHDRCDDSNGRIGGVFTEGCANLCHAARHLAACACMAGRIGDRRGVETHETYVARLRAEHGRKSGFWSRVG